MRKILYFIQLPPPVHGVTIMNHIIINSDKINKRFKSKILRINYSKKIQEINHLGISKILKYLKLLIKYYWLNITNVWDIIYFTIPPTGKGFYKDLPFILISKITSQNILYHLHGKGINETISTSNFRKQLYRFVFSNSSIIHLSNVLMDVEIKALNLENTRYFVVKNGIKNIEGNQPGKSFDINNIKILFLSNLSIPKGIYFAIEIINELIKNGYSVHLNVIGDFADTKTEKMVKQFVKENTLESHVTFLGSLYGKNKHEIIEKNDFLLYPTFNDAFPLVIIECLQHGVPVVASDQGGIPEMITDKTGFIFKTGDLNDALLNCENMVALLENSYSETQTECINLYNREYTLEVFENRMLKVFQKVTS